MNCSRSGLREEHIAAVREFWRQNGVHGILRAVTTIDQIFPLMIHTPNRSITLQKVFARCVTSSPVDAAHFLVPEYYTSDDRKCSHRL